MMGKKPTLETYNELQVAYDFFNQQLFDNTLPSCLITFQREKQTLAYFNKSRFVNRHDQTLTDEIAMNPVYFSIRSISETLSTLVHEMVHLWQYHFGTPGRGGYHNKEWGDKMESIGLGPSDTGKPGGKRTGDCMDHFIITGGKFDLACQKLITRKFTLSWLDRFPPHKPLENSEIVEEFFQLTTKLIESSVNENLNPDEVKILPAIQMPLGVSVNKSNRVKYRCPNCYAQVWGKPNLNLLCGETLCNAIAYEQVE